MSRHDDTLYHDRLLVEPDARCEGRYPVPHRRDEPFQVTYRCGLRFGHDGPHGAADGDTAPTPLTPVHTPGPWVVSDERFNGRRRDGIAASVLTADHHLFLAEIWDDFEADALDATPVDGIPPHGTAFANARLIAAAPKLLAAAETLVAALEALQGYLSPSRALTYSPALRDATTAILAATGRLTAAAQPAEKLDR